MFLHRFDSLAGEHVILHWFISSSLPPPVVFVALHSHEDSPDLPGTAQSLTTPGVSGSPTGEPRKARQTRAGLTE